MAVAEQAVKDEKAVSKTKDEGAQKEETPTAKGSYVVLALVEGGTEAWRPIGMDVEAPSALAAIKHVVGSGEDALPGTYRAVPMRSWHTPITVVAETRTVVSFLEQSPF